MRHFFGKWLKNLNNEEKSMPFDIETNDARSALAKAKDAGVSVSGDESNGSFDGTFSGQYVKGRYSVSGNIVHIAIDKKPWYVKESLVKSKLEEFLTKN
jgi:hypothetical protein